MTAKGVTIYTVSDYGGEGSAAFANKREAMRYARDCGGTVEKCKTVPLTKANFIRMFGSGTGPTGWCVSSEEIAEFDPPEIDPDEYQ